MLSRTGSTTTLKAYDMGWKDNILVRAHETLKFIAKFEDYTDATHPFMCHCHMIVHEDEGMMGQFVVTGASATSEPAEAPSNFSIFPNPAQSRIFIKMADVDVEIYYLKIVDASGRIKLMLPQPQVSEGVDVSRLSPGTYFVQITDTKTKAVIVQ